jgi:hypothetical protein
VQYWTISCETGCTCCNSDNHKRGPYSSREAAETRLAFFKEHPLLGSIYAPNGIYTISGPWKGEQLPDGRIIAEDQVYLGFWDLNQNLEERIAE